MIALAESDIEACDVCRPDTDLVAGQEGEASSRRRCPTLNRRVLESLPHVAWRPVIYLA